MAASIAKFNVTYSSALKDLGAILDTIPPVSLTVYPFVSVFVKSPYVTVIEYYPTVFIYGTLQSTYVESITYILVQYYVPIVIYIPSANPCPYILISYPPILPEFGLTFYITN